MKWPLLARLQATHHLTHEAVAVPHKENVTNAPPPSFNRDFVPEAPEYKGAGYRPVSAETTSAVQNR
ncbi:MAG: hypothetical protein DME18_08130 [Verrucomicrobia bacterium]|nr:MAG: hypothetical protein DME18_08130 [Verrucomicrobiota bacterium]